MSYSAHADTFARDNLPPRAQWPELQFELPELQYPGRLNCATELLDKPVTRGLGHRIALRTPDGECTYTQLFTQANRLANVLVREMGLKPGNRVLLRGPNNPIMAACWFAVMKAGGVCVATMPLLRAKELTEIIQKAEISHALCDKRLDAELIAAASNCPSLRHIKFWFDDAPGSLEELSLRQPLWFTADAEIDRQIRDRFRDTWSAAARGELDRWTAEPRGALALVVVLDQFSRNLERGNASHIATTSR